MVGSTVQLYLKTPLFRFEFEDGGKQHRFPAGIVIVEGKVKSDKGGGFWLDVSRIGQMDGPLTEERSGLNEVFIPTGKVDFVRFLATE